MVAAIQADAAPDISDLQRKLSTTEALRSYEKVCFDSRILDAGESERQLRVRLACLETQHQMLSQKCADGERYAAELEALAHRADADQKRSREQHEQHEQQLKAMHAENTSLKGRLKSLEDELRDMRNANQSSATELVAQRNEMARALAERMTESQQANERAKALEADVEAANAARRDTEKQMKSLRKELTDAHDAQIRPVRDSLAKALQDIQDLKTQHKTELEEAERRLEAQHKSELEEAERRLKAQHETELEEAARRLEEAKASSSSQNASERKGIEQQLAAHSTERKALEEQVATLTHQLEQERRAAARTTSAAAQSSESAQAAKAELATLAASLKKETKAREKAQRDLSKATEDFDARYKVLESRLESTQKKLKTAQAAAAAAKATTKTTATTTTTTPGETGNPRKRASAVAGLTMQDLEKSVKKPRQKTPPKASDFSLTPFLKKQAQLLADGPADAPSSSRADDSGAGGGRAESAGPDQSIMVPALIESKQPTRMLLAGAGRKAKKSKKPASVASDADADVRKPTPSSPHASPEPSKENAPAENEPEAEDEEYVEEDSILMAVPPKPKPKPKPKSKPSKPKPSKAAQHKKSTTATTTSTTSTTSAAAADVDAPKKPTTKKTSKPSSMDAMFVGGGGAGGAGGIRPTLFDDDNDGSGRLRLVLDDAASSREPPHARGNVRRQKATRLAPPVGAAAFTNEISPPKKRPEALQKFRFGTKKA